MKIERIKSDEISIGFVVLCLDEGSPVLATHKVFTTEQDAIIYTKFINKERKPIIFEVRR